MAKTGRDDYETLVPTIEGVIWSLAPLAIIVILLRLYTRIKIIQHLGWDDWFMLLAIVLMIKNSCFVQVAVHFGLGRHVWDVSTDDARTAIKWDYLAQPSSIMAPTFGRISFALTLMSLVGPSRSRRTILWVIIVTQFLANSLCFIFILAQCKPVQLLWDKRLSGECWDLRFQEYYGYFDGAFNSFTDLLLAVGPAVMFWNLNMKRSLKVSLSLLMGLGIFAMVGSIVKTISLSSVGSHNDYTYNTSYLVIWYSVENYLVIIAASIPTLKPLISRRKSTSSGYPSMQSWMTRSSNRRGKSRAASRGHDLDDIPLTTMDITRVSVDGDTSQKNLVTPSSAVAQGNILKTSEVVVDFRARGMS